MRQKSGPSPFSLKSQLEHITGPVNRSCVKPPPAAFDELSGNNWHEQAPASAQVEINGSCFRSAVSVDPIDSPVRGRSLRRRRWPSSFASTSVPPFSSIASPVLKVCLMRLIQRDRTRYTATKARIPLSSGPSRSASSETIAAYDFTT